MMSDQEETNKIYKLTKIVCLEMYFTAVGSCGRRMTHDSGIINEHITVTVFYQWHHHTVYRRSVTHTENQ